MNQLIEVNENELFLAGGRNEDVADFVKEVCRFFGKGAKYIYNYFDNGSKGIGYMGANAYHGLWQ